MSVTVVARSAAGKVDASSFLSSVKSLILPGIKKTTGMKISLAIVTLCKAVDR